MNNTFFHNKGVLISEAKMREEHVYPVYNDYSGLITPMDFLDICRDTGQEIYGAVGDPEIRFTHEQKTRKYEARSKKPSEITRDDVDVYAQRSCFVLPIPGFTTDLNGNHGQLTITGIKPYDKDVLTKSSNWQHFKVAAGFQVRVCLNLCISVQGSVLDLKVRDIDMLREKVNELLTGYSADQDIETFRRFSNYGFNEDEYAQIIGKMRMYQYLPKDRQSGIGTLELPDTLVTQATKEFIQGPFQAQDGEVSAWQMYNHLTTAVKNTDISAFLDRNVNCMEVVDGLCATKEGINNKFNWYLN